MFGAMEEIGDVNLIRSIWREVTLRYKKLKR